MINNDNNNNDPRTCCATAGPAPPAEELPPPGRGRPLESQSQYIDSITGDMIVDVADGEVSGSSM